MRAALRLTTEAAQLLRAVGRQPYHDLPDLDPILPALGVEGFHLEPRALLDVASFLEGSLEIARRVMRDESATALARRASEVRDSTDVAGLIRRAVQPSGEVADDASPRLGELRRSIVRLRAQLHSVMESYLRGKEADRLLQDKLVTTRNDRYVLIVKAEHGGQIQGIIHGSSGSGASVFVEPLPAVELNNDIVSLADEERREVIRILQGLTALVGDRADDLAHALEVMGELDALQAMALLARDMDAVEPEISDDLRLELRNARHPLLQRTLSESLGIPRRSSRDVVPVTLRAGFGSPVLVISGPNTGGKTVALKSIGLLALMAQCGLHIPVDEGSLLPVFRRVFADIGDDQSIASDLSTFSAHLKSMVEMTRDLALPALVLLDEVGAGTDPTEGGALGVAVVDFFRRSGAMVVATTHHGLMKAYAQSTPGVTCASFGYDAATYEPTFRLSLGVPGRSLALEMAERLGLPLEVVADARSRLDRKEAQAEALLKELDQKREAVRREEARLDGEREALTAAMERQKTLEHTLEQRKRAEVERFVKELRRRGEEASHQAEEAIRQAVQRVETSRRAAAEAGTRARAEAMRSIQETQESILRDPEIGFSQGEAVPANLALAVGERVRVPALGIMGRILALPDGREAEIDVEGKRLRVPRMDLVPVEAGAALAKPRTLPNVQAKGGVPAEVHVVGLTVEEALPRVDKLLDDAVLAERREVRVIHGFGQGRLRRAVAGLLEGHPHVARFRAGEAGEGGGGVTVVELKD